MLQLHIDDLRVSSKLGASLALPSPSGRNFSKITVTDRWDLQENINNDSTPKDHNFSDFPAVMQTFFGLSLLPTISLFSPFILSGLLGNVLVSGEESTKHPLIIAHRGSSGQ